MPWARPSSSVCSVGKRREGVMRNPDVPTLARQMSPGARRGAVRVLLALAVVLWVLATGSAASLLAAQPAAQAEPHATEAAAGHGEAEGEAGRAESVWAVTGRLFNFALLAGALVYLLRSPLMGYLTQRGIQVRSELTKAAALRKEAGAELDRVEARMKAMPAEIEALKRRGAEEIAAEEDRISRLAASERHRLLEQAKREIETELRVAERALKTRAGELAVDVATARVKRTITDRDQARLVDQYVTQVRQ
jgi:F-type H+-transporting ATPase subunit b